MFGVSRAGTGRAHGCIQAMRGLLFVHLPVLDTPPGRHGVMVRRAACRSFAAARAYSSPVGEGGDESRAGEDG